MSRRRNGVECPACGGWVTSPRRGVTLDTAVANHNQSCPAQTKEKKKDG